MSETIQYELKHPFTIRLTGSAAGGAGERSETVSTVMVRTDVRARDLKVLDSNPGEVAKAAALIRQLTDLTPKQVDDLYAVDFIALSDLVAGFMPPGLSTGETA